MNGGSANGCGGGGKLPHKLFFDLVQCQKISWTGKLTTEFTQSQHAAIHVLVSKVDVCHMFASELDSRDCISWIDSQCTES